MPDLILMSTDSVYFYVHKAVILEASTNGFNFILAKTPHSTPPTVSTSEGDSLSVMSVIQTPEVSDVLNLILHVIYDLPCSHFKPSFASLADTIGGLLTYGVLIRDVITPASHIFLELMTYAPQNPLALYTLAASYKLEHLAVASSAYLLSICLSTITDEIAQRIGAVYIRRLFLLHYDRMAAFRRNLQQTPEKHPPTLSCDFSDQERLTRAWSIASVYLVLNARPGEPIFS